MTLPAATYRLQFRNGMDFDRAVEIVPYLQRLGISHLYASPIFTAVKGSTHGYDITDHNEIDPALGGHEGFERLSRALRAAGLGLILDIVPNHMAASLDNRWWRSVVEWGKRSCYAGHFDIDWSRKLTLPILGRPAAEAIEAAELALAIDDEEGALTLRYFDTRLPLHPETYAAMLEGIGDPLAAQLVRAAAAASPQAEEEFHQQVRSLLRRLDERARLSRALDALSCDHSMLSRIIDLQRWRLLHWKEARRDLSYRRFFEITGLVGVRVEDAAVFDDVHRLTLELMRSGQIDGLRIDHVDGLADPKAYLERLRREAGEDTYIVVEKVLGHDEHLPEDWPVSGTTGYEFIDALSGLLADPEGVGDLSKTYAEISDGADPQALRRDAKRLMATQNFAGEHEAVAGMAAALAAELGVDATEAKLGAALTELIVAFPVYRTYGTADGMPESDRVFLERLFSNLRDAGRGEPVALDLLERILKGDVPQHAAGQAGLMRTRLQQLTGPVMAKAVEDTFFFRHNAFLALNEVGGDPLRVADSMAAFHQVMGKRAQTQPRGLSTTATHDTKRGEDARARLYALSEAPVVWAAAVARWRGMNGAAVRLLADGSAPEPETEWMLYQALAGIWPVASSDKEPVDGLGERFLGHVGKSLREAKRRTSWTGINQAYEDAVKAYASWLLSPENTGFRTDFAGTLDPFIKAGLLNGLTQTLIKMTAPGVPDIYQGAERLDFSLTDPDNRRPVDFSRFDDGFFPDSPLDNATAETLSSGAFKQRLIARCLALRRRHPVLFAEGTYVPLETTGPRQDKIVAFMRSGGGEVAIVVAPRLMLGLLAEEDFVIAADLWGDTMVELPAEAADRPLRDMLTGRQFEPARQLAARLLLRETPVALLLSGSAESA